MSSDEAERLYRDLYQQLEALWAAGKGESPEADALCDRMDEPWYAMTAEAQDRVTHGGLPPC